jgi:protein-disulfide isomerase
MRKTIPSFFQILRNYKVQIVCGLLCLVFAFFAGMLWVENAELKDDVAIATKKTEVLSKQLTSVSDFKDVRASLVPLVTSADRIDGNTESTKVYLIEYSDLECPYCKDLHGKIDQVKADFGSDVSHVFRHLPIESLHASAPMQAEAAECIAQQSGNPGFFKFISQIFAGSKSNGKSYTEASIQALAAQQGFDASKLKACMDTNQTTELVNSSIKQARDIGITGTPTWFLVRVSDGKTKQAVGTRDYASMKSTITQLLEGE